MRIGSIILAINSQNYQKMTSGKMKAVWLMWLEGDLLIEQVFDRLQVVTWIEQMPINPILSQEPDDLKHFSYLFMKVAEDKVIRRKQHDANQVCAIITLPIHRIDNRLEDSRVEFGLALEVTP